MISVQTRVGGVKAMQKLIAWKEKELEKLRTEHAFRTKLLQDEIAKGDTTGDPLRDLVIRAYGLNDEITAQYRQLQDRLVGKKGEFVLIRYHSEVRQRFGGEVRSSDFRHEMHFRIGVLQTEQLCLTTISHLVTLPIPQYLQGVWGIGARSVVADGKPSPGTFFECIDSEDQPPPLAHYMTEAHLAGDLLIGDDAVRAELVKNRDGEFFNVAAERLGRLILQPTD